MSEKTEQMEHEEQPADGNSHPVKNAVLIIIALLAAIIVALWLTL